MKLICEFCGKEYEYDGSLPRSWGTKGSYFSKSRFCCYECGLAYKKKRLSDNHKKRLEENPNYWKDRHEKTKKTNLERYGHENIGQFGSKEFNETIYRKYGVVNTSQNKEIHEKMINTSRKHWGNNFNNREKAVQTSLKNFGRKNYNNKEKSKETNLKKYGTEYTLQSLKVRQKIDNTNLKKYGNKIYAKSQKFQENKDKIIYKQISTKKLHNSFNTSKPEEEIYQLLLKKFEKVERQYKSELYPFNCDFYIPSLDLYIEVNFHWTHGKEPFNENNEEHIKLIESWKEKNSEFYKSAVRVWTIRDPLKRKIAKENNLNWIEFFNIEEFYEWYNKGAYDESEEN